MDHGGFISAQTGGLAMAALTNRQEARARLTKLFEAALERVIPVDETLDLKGRTFREWEDQADEFDRTLTAALLEERAALEDNARVKEGGRCPRCSSTRLYLIGGERQKELQTPHGVVALKLQSVRCRACGSTFSPSGA
jgi:DNA-directed RNA polymerase subunit RPC12/RpoP